MCHLRVDIGRREFGGDELRLQPGPRQGVWQPGLRMAMMWSTQASTVLGGPKLYSGRLYSGRPSRTVSTCLISSIS
jgi:hypothetical protein